MKRTSNLFPVFLIIFIFILLSFNTILAADTEEPNTVTVMSADVGGGKGGGGGGGAGGSANASLFTGAATYAIPITTPPGRLGVAPNISINYSSQAGSGWIGVGWGFDMGSIQRSLKDGVDYNGDDYIYSKDGSASPLIAAVPPDVQPLLPGCSNEYRSKIEDGSFILFCKNANSWTAYDKNGMVYHFGQNDQSKQFSGANVFQWKLDKVEDANGNYMTITYQTIDGQIYPQQIDYTGNSNTSLPTTNSVVFELVDMGDDDFSYITHSRVTTSKRLHRIITYASGQIATAYEFSYDLSAITGRTILKKVVRFGSDYDPAAVSSADKGTSLPETVFYYNGDPNETDASLYFDSQTPVFQQGLNPYFNRKTGTVDVSRFKPGDFNGDGRTDFLFISDNDAINSRIYVSRGGGSFTSYALPFHYYADENDGPSYSLSFRTNRFILGDFNGDGTTDFLVVYRGMDSGFAYPDPRSENNSNKLYLVKVNSAGNLYFESHAAPNFNTYFCSVFLPLADPRKYQYNDGYLSRIKLGDFNGDMMTDILFVEGFSDSYTPARIYLAHGTGFNAPINGPSFYMADGTSCGGQSTSRMVRDVQRVRVADFNADGISDIHYIPNMGGSAPSNLYYFSYDNGSLSWQQKAGPSFYISGYTHFSNTCNTRYRYAVYDLGRIRYGDFNGDKITDIFEIRANTTGNLYYGTGNPDSPFETRPGIGPVVPVFGPYGASKGEFNKSMIDISRAKIADFDGDGRADIMRVTGGSVAGPNYIYQSDGLGFQAGIPMASASNTPYNFTVDPSNYESCTYPGLMDANRFIMGDFVGNGKTGFLYANGWHDWVSFQLYTARPNETDLIKKIRGEIPTTGEIISEISLTYASSVNYPGMDMPFTMRVLKSMKVNPKTAGSVISESTYHYEDGYFDRDDKEFRGFGYVKQTNPDGTTLESWFHQEDGSVSINTRRYGLKSYATDEDFKGKQFFTRFRDASGTTLSETEMIWDRSVPVDTYPVFVKIVEKNIFAYVGGVQVGDSYERYTCYVDCQARI